MAIELLKEKYTSSINVVEIGAARSQGPTRGNIVKIGGQTALPFLYGEGEMPNRPVMAMEIYDLMPDDWSFDISQAFGKKLTDPIAWAEACVNDRKADALCVRLISAHPDYGKRPCREIIAFIERLIRQISVPLIIIGSQDNERDTEILPEVSHALRKENCLMGIVSQDNYKTLAASCLADGHSLIAESPIDINIAKQVNILISDMGYDPKRIVMHPTTASLGYGLEYVYSIMERSRLAAFSGDWTLAMPMILFIGQEVWRVKEAKESETVGIAWEFATASLLLQAGADILVMRHPKAARQIQDFIGTIIQR